MGVETAALLGVNALGQAAGIFGQSKQNKESGKRRNELLGFLQNDPGAAENSLMNFLPYINSNAAFNTGQDALMQYLRADPSTQRTYVDDTLQGIATQRDPFAAGGAYSAMDAVNRREQARQIAQLQGSSGSLGRRFGSNGFNAEVQLRATQEQNAAAQRAALANDWVNQRLGAASLANSREGQMRDARFGAANSLQQGGMSQLALLLQSLQGAGNLEAQRRASNVGLLGGAYGMGNANLGQGVGDAITQLSALYYLMKPNQKTSSTPGSGVQISGSGSGGLFG